MAMNFATAHFREFPNESDARRFEARFKKLSTRARMKFVVGFQKKVDKITIFDR